MRTVIISDVHGNFEALKECLINANVINEKGNRMNDAKNRAYVIQIGDLANCVEESVYDDYKCLGTVGSWIDLMLMGNHELPYWSPKASFSGFHFNAEIGRKLRHLEENSQLVPAALVGPYLISHAGWGKHLDPFIESPQDAARSLRQSVMNHGWDFRLFSSIGYSRGGRDKNGGIVWEDFRDLQSPFPQIVGHTVGKTIRVKENAICIDTGGGKYGKPTAIEVN